MPKFSKLLLERITDDAVREETARSLAQRGIVGHYIAGLIRVISHPIMQWWIHQRLRYLRFINGIQHAAHYVEHLNHQYTVLALRQLGAAIGEQTIISEGLRLSTVYGNTLQHLTIGNGVFIGHNNIIDLSQAVIIGDYCTLTHQCALFSHIDIGLSPLKSRIIPVQMGAIRIGRGTYVGSQSFISHGVIIGECAIIGAKSYVDKHVPPYTMVVGTPAKVIARINPEQVPPFEAVATPVIPEQTSPDRFPYDDPHSLKIPENCRILGSE